MIRRLLGSAAWLILAAGVAAQPATPVFRPVPLAQRPARPPDPSVKRETLVTANLTSFVALERRAHRAFQGLESLAQVVVPPSPVILNLFPGLTFSTLRNQWKATLTNQGKTLVCEGQGVLTGNLPGELILAKTGDTFTVTIRANHGPLYEVQPVPGQAGIYSIREIDLTKAPPPGPPVVPEPKRKVAVPDLPPDAKEDDGALLDVLVVYTSAVKNALGSQQGVENRIAVAEAETNQGYRNSGVIQQIRVVHRAEVAYDESSGYRPALARLANGEYGLKVVHKLRDHFGADMVCLWISHDEYAGLAYILTDQTLDFEGSAFSVVNYKWATGYYSFGHELGHNQGAGHDAGNHSGGAFPDSRGYQQWKSQPFFRTIMAYDCPGKGCVRVNHWSNPGVNYDKLPTGVKAQADNARTLNETRMIAARWRKSKAPPLISRSGRPGGPAVAGLR
jgi:hypothetical protein